MQKAGDASPALKIKSVSGLTELCPAFRAKLSTFGLSATIGTVSRGLLHFCATVGAKLGAMGICAAIGAGGGDWLGHGRAAFRAELGAWGC